MFNKYTPPNLTPPIQFIEALVFGTWVTCPVVMADSDWEKKSFFF